MRQAGISGSAPRQRPRRFARGASSVESSGSSRKWWNSFSEDHRPRTNYLGLRECLLLLIEAFLSFATYIVQQRNLSHNIQLNQTRRQILVFSLYTDGYSTLTCMFIGCIADSYVTYYVCALVTVFLHFTMISLIFMEAAIMRGNPLENPYARPLTTLSFVALSLIKASDFTRLVYALEGMANRTKSTIGIYIFLHFWVSSYSIEGGVIVNLFAGLVNYLQLGTSTFLSFAACVLNGLSLFLFVYVFHPGTNRRELPGLGCQIVGCLVVAIYCKLLGIKRRPRAGFFGNTEGIFNKYAVNKTWELAKVYILLTPALGLVFLTGIPSDLFFRPITERITSSEWTVLIGMDQLARSVLSITMLLSYFLLWPALNRIGLKNNDTIKFLTGHLTLTLAVYYATFLMKNVQALPYSYNSAGRVYNCRDSTVVFNPVDRNFPENSIPPKAGINLAFPASKCQLIPFRVEFEGTKTNFTMFLSFCPRRTSGYIILDPPKVVAINDNIPLREGPPGTNLDNWPRIFIFNAVPDLHGTFIHIRQTKTKVFRQITLPRIKTTILSLKPDLYDFAVYHADIRKSVLLEEGAIYGVIIYESISKREMAVDVVQEPNVASYWRYLVLFFFLGIGSSLSYPSLRAIVFRLSPQGLLSMSFAYLAFMEGISKWICYIAFTTLHEFMTSDVFLAYGTITITFFFICLFVIFKYRKLYP